MPASMPLHADRLPGSCISAALCRSTSRMQVLGPCLAIATPGFMAIEGWRKSGAYTLSGSVSVQG